MSEPKKKNKGLIYTISLLTLIVIVILLTALFDNNFKEASPSNDKIRELSTMYTKVKANTGAVEISLDISLSIEEPKYFNKREIEKAIINDISNMSYEDVTGKNAINNITAEILASVGRAFPRLVVDKVYITDFAIGDVARDKQLRDEGDTVKQRNNYINGIFKNISSK